MLTSTKTGHQTNFFGSDLLLQLDFNDPLIQLALAIPWADFDNSFSQYYTKATGRPSKPIRLMVGLLLLKQLENLSDEKIVLQFKRNPYYQVFCDLTEFSNKPPCDSTELVKFRNRIGKEGFENIFQMSVRLHGKAALEDTVNIDTTVQEKNITYPTDAKLAIKIINRLNKLAKSYDVQQRRTYKKEVKNLRLSIRHFRHPRRRKSAKKALKRLRTIAGILIRELRRRLPKYTLFEQHQKDFLFYERVLKQQPKDSNKASLVSTAKTNIIVGVVSHDRNCHDNHTLPEVLAHIEASRGKPVSDCVCDRGYRGRKPFGDTSIILPAPPLKRYNRYQRDKKRKRCQRRAAIEQIIGHLKSDYRLGRNYLKGISGDEINLLMAACAWNLNKWMKAVLLLVFSLNSRGEIRVSLLIFTFSMESDV